MVPLKLKHYEAKLYESISVSRDSDVGFARRDHPQIL